MNAQHTRSSEGTPSYTTRHRHHLPGLGYTDWSEGILNGRHTHAVEASDRLGYIGDSVGSPVHRHAWTLQTKKRTEHGHTSGPFSERPFPQAMQWIGRVLRH